MITCFARNMRKPLFSTVTAYSPGSRFCKLKEPLSLVVVLTSALVLACPSRHFCVRHHGARGIYNPAFQGASDMLAGN